MNSQEPSHESSSLTNKNHHDGRLFYTRDQLLALRASPLVKTPDAMKEHDELWIHSPKKRPKRSGTNESLDGGSSHSLTQGDREEERSQDSAIRSRRPVNGNQDRRSNNVVDGRFGANQPQNYNRSNSRTSWNEKSQGSLSSHPRSGTRPGSQHMSGSPAWMSSSSENKSQKRTSDEDNEKYKGMDEMQKFRAQMKEKESSSNENKSWRRSADEDEDKYKGMDEMQKFRAQMKEKEAAMKGDTKSTTQNDSVQQKPKEEKKTASKVLAEPALNALDSNPTSVDALFAGPLATEDPIALFKTAVAPESSSNTTRATSGGRSRFEKLFSSESNNSSQNAGSSAPYPLPMSSILPQLHPSISSTQNATSPTEKDREGMQRIMAMLAASAQANSISPNLPTPVNAPAYLSPNSDAQPALNASGTTPKDNSIGMETFHPQGNMNPTNPPQPQGQGERTNPEDPQHLDYLTQLLRSTMKIGRPLNSQPSQGLSSPFPQGMIPPQHPQPPFFRPMMPGFMPAMPEGAPPMMIPAHAFPGDNINRSPNGPIPFHPYALQPGVHMPQPMPFFGGPGLHAPMHELPRPQAFFQPVPNATSPTYPSQVDNPPEQRRS